MSNALKGALLSGLVFPGLGQLVLRHYRRGLAFIGVVLAALILLVMKAVDLALAILQQLEAEGRLINIETITEAANQAATGSGSLLINGLFMLIIACWIGGIVDAYKLGKKLDRMTG